MSRQYSKAASVITYDSKSEVSTGSPVDLLVNGGSVNLVVFQAWASLHGVAAITTGRIAIMDSSHNNVFDVLAATTVDTAAEGLGSHELSFLSPLAGQGVVLKPGEALCFLGRNVSTELISGGVSYGS